MVCDAAFQSLNLARQANGARLWLARSALGSCRTVAQLHQSKELPHRIYPKLEPMAPGPLKAFEPERCSPAFWCWTVEMVWMPRGMKCESIAEATKTQHAGRIHPPEAGG